MQSEPEQHGGVQVAGVGSLCSASEVLGWLYLLPTSHMVLRSMIWLEILLPYLSIGSEIHRLHLLQASQLHRTGLQLHLASLTLGCRMASRVHPCKGPSEVISPLACAKVVDCYHR